MLHAWQKYGTEAAQSDYERKYNAQHRAANRPAPDFRRVVRGKVEFIRFVRGDNDCIYRRFIKQYADLHPEARVRFRREETHPELERALWVLENLEDEKITQGTGFMLDRVGLVLCQREIEG